MKIESFTIKDIQQGYKKKYFSVVELTKAYLNRCKKYNDIIGAFISLNEEKALKEAAAIDAKIFQGHQVGLLAGIPIALKDNICTRGIRTTCASKMLQDFLPPYDATVVEKLKEMGAIIIGKTNMDEFAMGSSTENSFFGITRNPWNITKVPGGSSGGSAAAVTAGFVPIALGTDTGGSIRQPASFCGVVGLKPTYGLVSRYGLIAFSSSLDHIGPLARKVEDCGLILQAIQGFDERDSTSYRGKVVKNYLYELKKDVKGFKIGIPKEFFQNLLEPEVAKVIDEVIKQLEKMGFTLEEFSLPIIEEVLPVYYIISSAEASSNLARYDGIAYGYNCENFKEIEELIVNNRTEAFGKEVKRRIMLGTYLLYSGYYDNYYKKALILQKKIKFRFAEAFKNYDAILTPTSPILPFNIGEKINEPFKIDLIDAYTVSSNIAGLPSISIPCGFSSQKLPIGLQLIGNYFSEEKLFKIAHNIEEELKLYEATPVLQEDYL